MAPKVELSVLHAELAAPIAALLNDYRVWRPLSDIVPYPYTEKDAQDFIACVSRDGSPLRNTFAVQADGQLAGLVGYQLGELNKSHIATVGYWYGQTFWGRGIATAALRLLLEKVASDPQVRRVEASVFAFNEASQRVLEKCGFVREAVLKEALSKEGKLYDEVVFRWVGTPG